MHRQVRIFWLSPIISATGSTQSEWEKWYVNCSIYIILEANKLRNAFPKVCISTPTHEHPIPISDGPIVDGEDLYASPLPTQLRLVSGIRQLPNSDDEEEPIIANSSSTLASTPITSTQLPGIPPPNVTHPRFPQENWSHASQIPLSPLTNISTEDQPPPGPPKCSHTRKLMQMEPQPLLTHARGNKNWTLWATQLFVSSQISRCSSSPIHFSGLL